ncbi:MAG: type 4a pilus biogenesis protein PilO [Actinomycetota bacterium]|nr:type 4a pilus biogenesis protein PilO [Actinomycetota bacterium]
MNKRVIALAVAASVVLVGIWYFGVFSRQSKSMSKANAQTAAATIEASNLRSEIGVLKQQKAHLADSKAKLTALKSALPDTPALDKLIDDLNGAAAQSGVDWQTVAPTKPATYTAGSAQAVAAGFPSGMQSLTVALQVNGGYKQVTDFVTKLTSLSRLLDVGSINLTGVSDGAKSSAQITSQIFFVPPPPGSVPTITPTTVTH